MEELSVSDQRPHPRPECYSLYSSTSDNASRQVVGFEIELVDILGQPANRMMMEPKITPGKNMEKRLEIVRDLIGFFWVQ